MVEQPAYSEPTENQDVAMWEGQMHKASRKLPQKQGPFGAPRRTDVGSWLEVWRRKRRGHHRKVLLANWRRDCNLLEFYFEDADQVAATLGLRVVERRHPRSELVPVCSVRAFSGATLSRQVGALGAAGFKIVPDHNWPSVPMQSDVEKVNFEDLSNEMQERLDDSIRNFRDLQARRTVVVERLSELGASALVENFNLKELHDLDMHALQSKLAALECLADLLAASR